VRCNDLVRLYQQSFARDAPPFDWEPWQPPYRRPNKQPGGCPLVVLDELGTKDKVTDTAYEVVQDLLDRREGWPLVVISNHPPEVIGELYDSRIVSRCEAGTKVNYTGPDRRIATA
jgi:hypothetical protein